MAVAQTRRRWWPFLDQAMIELVVRDVGGPHSPMTGLVGRFAVEASHPGPRLPPAGLHRQRTGHGDLVAQVDENIPLLVFGDFSARVHALATEMQRIGVSMAVVVAPPKAPATAG